MLLTGFPPLAGPEAHTLILGSMPGVASLDADQYYAHPRNAFWKIMAEFTGVAADAPYENRTAALGEAGFALWDVIHQCIRPGSLDSNIQTDRLMPNPFADFLSAHPEVRRILFNGQKAEALFRKLVLPNLDAHVELVRLPSTSPAHASLSLEEKKAWWLSHLLEQPTDPADTH